MEHKLRLPTEKQIKLAKSLNIDIKGKTFRVLSAEIADTLEVKSFKFIQDNKIKPGTKVEYTGIRNDLPKELIVSSIGKKGYVYFKKTNKYCRPWELKKKNIKKL